jgi:hypothetical protein
MNIATTTSPIQPSIHKPVPMGARVVLPEHYLGRPNVTGTVVGIASLHIFFTYIILLDAEIQTEYGPQKAVVVLGQELRGVNGEDWRLTKPTQKSG